MNAAASFSLDHKENFKNKIHLSVVHCPLPLSRKIQILKMSHYFINLTWPTFTVASTVQFAVVILLEKTRFQGIKVYFCLKNAKKNKRGQLGLTLENIEKPLIHFASPIPKDHWTVVWKSSPLHQKPLKCLENLPLSPSPVRGQERGPLYSMSCFVLSSAVGLVKILNKVYKKGS